MATDIAGRRVSSRTARLLRIGAVALMVLALLAVAGIHALRGTTTAEELAPGVYRIYSKSLLFRDGSNALAVRTRSGVMLVDTQLPSWTPRVQDAVREIFALPVSLVVNTHWHADHSGGNDQLTGTAEILAHENVRNLLSGPHQGFGLTGPGSLHVYDARPAAGLPERVYRDSLDLPKGADGSSIEAVHYANAHTDGDTVVYVGKGRFIAVGDIVWPGAFPFVDIHNGGSATGILAAIDDILIRSDSRSLILAGHREPMTRSELVGYRAMVSATIEIVHAAMGEGADLETILANGLPEKYAGFASAVVPEATWITMIHQSLEAAAPPSR